ncbi:NADP-dependent oxidoreductase domain-containing protein [Thelonectria olida]|uniref:NADP-dependent oxidoreductase domain-containing protein n=1 Tax=Thelonectria olida TaxID=1576542 RepID=A0A9P8VZ47_9HYPO|nr:NADP-dependent oxidoreductase domain-containing protein [Thelonectria olida]
MEYARLGNSGLKVSKIILGCMAFGSSKWEQSPWVLDEEDGLKLLKAAYDNGINTWDTADTYSNGKSEEIIGKALKKFNIPRQKVVILSKIFNPVMDDDSRPPSVNDGPLVNQMGLSRKHVFHAVDQCLKRLDTDYIDVLQIHRLDRETPPEEIMRALHEVVQSGKVRYIGASSMYAWEFARLQFIARQNGWTEFISMQPFYNLLYREEEREMIPFCRASGVGVIPWSPIARGLLAKPLSKGDDEGQETSLRSRVDKKTDKWFADANLDIVDRVEEIAANKGVSMAHVATAWVLQQGCYPIVGLSSEKRIVEAAETLKVKLSDEECRYLESPYKPRSIQGM